MSHQPNDREFQFQSRVLEWSRKCLGDPQTYDPKERLHRFLEEALELVQSLGLAKEDVLELVEYVYGREPGEKKQEVGGVMVTLAVLCSVYHMSLVRCAYAELYRILKPENMKKIREKQANKPKGPRPE